MDDFIVSRRYRRDELFLGFLAFGIAADHERARKSAESLASCKAEAAKQFDLKALGSYSPAELSVFLHNLLTEVVLEKTRGLKKDAHVTLGLTAGLDSRPLLMVLRENGASAFTYTFGEPGMLDFDFVNILCGKADLKNSFYETHTLDWNLGLYEKNIARFQDYALSPRVLVDMRLNSVFPDRYELHGHLNGQISNVKAPFSKHWDDAIQKFSYSNDTFRMQDWLGREAVKSLLPKNPFVDDQALELDKQLQLSYRLEQRVRPLDSEGVTYLLPYTNPRWVGFWLTRPSNDILNQHLWLSVLAEQGNELFFDLKLLKKPHRTKFQNLQIGLTYGKLWGESWYRQLHQRLKIRPHVPQAPLEHFDLYTTYLKSSSFRALIHEAMTRLKGRRIFSDGFLDDILHKFKRGDWRARKRINGLVTTDILIETGILSR